MQNLTLDTAHRIIQLLNKYSDSDVVQKILTECFDNNENLGLVRSFEPGHDQTPDTINPSRDDRFED